MDGHFSMIFLLLWMITAKHDRASGVNIALAKNSRQSSTFETYGPEKAVDGDTTDRGGGHFLCTHTENEYQAWWAVDLGNTYEITNVIVYNRKDAEIASSWLNNYDIDVFAQPACFCDKWNEFSRGRKSRCYFQLSSVLILNATCQEQSIGRFVRIRHRNSGYLNLCEVEVYGSFKSNPIGSISSSRKACGFPNKEYTGIDLVTTAARSSIDCTHMCLTTYGCCAGVYDEATRTCILKRKSDTDENTTDSFLDSNTTTSWLV